MLKKAVFSGVALSVGLSACADGKRSLTDFFSDSTEIGCKRAYECCTPTSAQAVTGQDSACSASDGDIGKLIVAFYQDSIDAKRVIYDAATGDSCIENLKTLTCSEVVKITKEDSAVCGAALIPQVAAGGACTQDYECTTGYCDISGDSDDGKCAAAPTATSKGAICTAK